MRTNQHPKLYQQQARLAHMVRIGAPQALVGPNINPRLDNITQMLDRAMRQPQDTIIRVDVDEGQEIEVGVQHRDNETNITLKKLQTTRQPKEEITPTTPPNSPDTPRRKPRQFNQTENQIKKTSDPGTSHREKT